MKHNIGDKVRVKSLEWYNANKNRYGNIQYSDSRVFFESNMSKFCGSIVTIKDIDDIDLGAYKVEENTMLWTDNMFEENVEETSLRGGFGLWENKINGILFSNENYADKVELCLGDDYEIVVEDGKTFVQKKKPKYPTTYEECRKVLGIDEEMIVHGGWYKHSLIRDFYKLLICRDAYWKIAGEEMGLGKPWEPEYVSLVNNEYFTIHTFNNEIIKSGTSHRNAILAFPTEEMRDAFYENFKDLIEKCKELL